jgi:hypothetical protein
MLEECPRTRLVALWSVQIDASLSTLSPIE